MSSFPSLDLGFVAASVNKDVEISIVFKYLVEFKVFFFKVVDAQGAYVETDNGCFGVRCVFFNFCGGGKSLSIIISCGGILVSCRHL